MTERTLSTLKRILPVKLTSEDMGIMGLRLANVIQKHGEFDLQASTTRKELLKQEAAYTADIEKIAASIRSGVEEREVTIELLACRRSTSAI